MKRHSLILGFLFLALPALTNAESFGDFSYTVKGDNTIEITGYTGSDGDPEIPNTIDGKPVSAIGDSAFQGCTNLINVRLPDNVRSIGGKVFWNCSSLTNIVLSVNLNSIFLRTFAYCPNLVSITVPEVSTFFCSKDGVLFNKSQTSLIAAPGGKTGTYTITNTVTNVMSGAFIACAKLTGVTIPASVVAIGDETFYECHALAKATIYASIDAIPDKMFLSCSNLTAVALPASIVAIGEKAFWNCRSLAEIALPASVITIGDKAFAQCMNLTGVTIPANVAHIGEGAFQICPRLAAIDVNAGNSVYSSKDGVLFDKTQTLLITAPGGKTGAYSVPAGVVGIGEGAFCGAQI